MGAFVGPWVAPSARSGWSHRPVAGRASRILRSRPFALRFWDRSLVPARNGEGPVFALRSPPVVACALRAPGQLGIAPAVVASLGCAGPRSVADRPSEPAFSRVAAEITRFLIGVDARAQPADAFVFEDRPGDGWHPEVLRAPPPDARSASRASPVGAAITSWRPGRRVAAHCYGSATLDSHAL